MDAANLERVDGAPHLLDRQRPASAVHNELRNERVVEWRDHGPVGHAAVHPDALAGRRAVGHDAARGREEIANRVFRVHPTLDRVAPMRDLGRRDLEAIPRRDPKLLSDEVDAGHGLGDRVLHLEPRIHLVECETAVVEQEFHRAGVPISHRLKPADGHVDEARSERSRDGGRGSLFDELLMTSLDTALPLDEPDGAAGVNEDLNLDVSRTLKELLEEEVRIPEVRQRDIARGLERAGEFGRSIDTGHANAPAPGRCLEEDRISDLPGDDVCIVGRLDDTVNPLGDGHSRGRHRPPRGNLVAGERECLGGRPDEDEPFLRAPRRERRVLR